MEALKIALLQVAPCDTLERNLEKGIASCRKAKDLSMTIGITLLKQYEGGPRNSMVLFDRHGARSWLWRNCGIIGNTRCTATRSGGRRNMGSCSIRRQSRRSSGAAAANEYTPICFQVPDVYR